LHSGPDARVEIGKLANKKEDRTNAAKTIFAAVSSRLNWSVEYIVSNEARILSRSMLKVNLSAVA
jgi:hypothetical protein